MTLLSFALLPLLLAGCGNEDPGQTPRGGAGTPVFPEKAASNALARAVSFVRNCTPRDAGTPGAEKAANWIASSLAADGFVKGKPFTGTEASFFPDGFTNATPRGKLPFCNVLAAIPAAEPSSSWIFLLSHFDTMSGISPRFEGANDGASSTALLLELADWLKKHPLRKQNVLCAFLDGEECMVAYSEQDGFHGSKRLAAQNVADRRDLRAVILMDMIGDADLKITVPRNGAASLRSLALEAAEAVGERDRIGLFDGYIYDDHHAFFERGYPAVDLIDFYYGSEPEENDYWHTPKDTLDKLSARSLYTTARIVLEMLRRLDGGI